MLQMVLAMYLSWLPFAPVHRRIDMCASSMPHRRLLVKLLLLVMLAFGFGFALVPLYDVLCKATGFNGKSVSSGFSRGGLSAAGVSGGLSVPDSSIDRSRWVTVEFTGTIMPGLAWEMRPLTVSLDVHPGSLQQVRYLVSNRSGQTVVGQAVPSVTPGQAAQYFEKIDCFCFSQQRLAPGETKELPLTFILKPDISKEIRHVTLGYSFFNAAPNGAAIDGRRLQ